MQVKTFFLLVFVALLTLAPGCWPLSPHGVALLKFKERIESDPRRILSWWNDDNNNTACRWPGVSCKNGSVIRINLRNFSLGGSVAPELGQISTLKILLLGRNLFYGPIPKELGDLKDLNVLDLGFNKLSGRIPREIGNASKLTYLSLEYNSLHGRIPSELGKLVHLKELRLNMNMLTGQLPVGTRFSAPAPMTQNNVYLDTEKDKHISSDRFPGLCELWNLSIGNFSNNLLSGYVPSCLLYLPSWSFEWNCFQKGNHTGSQRPVLSCDNSRALSFHFPMPKNDPETGQFKVANLLHPSGLALLGVSLLLGIAALLLIKGKPMAVSPLRASVGDLKLTTFTPGVPEISLLDLQQACEDFSNIIGCSSESVVFKGILSDGTEIAVSTLRSSGASWSHDSELYFRSKVEGLARMNHEHVVKLLGYCSEDEPFTRMLVFEYMPNGTLFDLLHNGDSEQLDWDSRIRILMGVAYGLRYLHHELHPPVNFALLDSNSVFLTEDFAAKLADFDTWKLALMKGEHKKEQKKGNYTMAPSDLDDPAIWVNDMEADIFSFGIIILELITGRPPYSKTQGSLLHWAEEFLGSSDVISYMVDPKLRFFSFRQLEALIQIIKVCTCSETQQHPTMDQITCMLETSLGISAAIACPKPSPLAWAELTALSQM